MWYYAFGANMSRKKLTGSRKIQPSDSVAVRMPGWALEFNHRSPPSPMDSFDHIAPALTILSCTHKGTVSEAMKATAQKLSPSPKSGD